MEESYPVGKLPPEHLSKLLSMHAGLDPSVILGPQVGEDAAVIKSSPGMLLVTKTDPITFATDEIGSYAVHVNANDIACSGAMPRWWMATVLLPEGDAPPSLADTIFSQMAQACEEVGAVIVGGHTEITADLTRPIVVGSMIGEVQPQSLIKTGGARTGDHLLLTKGIAVEGSAIIARELGSELKDRVSSDVLDRAASFLRSPGISVVRDAYLAIQAAGLALHSLHDPTEGGLSAGLLEMSLASGRTLHLHRNAIPVLPETEILCRELDLDPLGLIASGCLLMAVAPEVSDRVVEMLTAERIPTFHVGTVKENGIGVTLEDDGVLSPMPVFKRDEIARLFSSI